MAGETRLPGQSAQLFLTDGGMETDLIFNRGIDLPLFASFTLLADDSGRQVLADYFTPYLDTARQHGTGFVFETPTWRASPEWGAKLGYDAAALDRLNREAVELMQEVRDGFTASGLPGVVSGNFGPRGDGYQPGALMEAVESAAYHAPQAVSLARAGADIITAMTMTHVGEAAGIALAARDAGVPSVISFTVETDGRLPDGTPLGDAIAAVDEITDGAPLYYMVNCAHPDHFGPALDEKSAWMARIGGIRANASRCSHAELDEAEALDEGDPLELGGQYRELLIRFPHLRVLGGCCGTDHRHVTEIARACAA